MPKIYFVILVLFFITFNWSYGQGDCPTFQAVSSTVIPDSKCSPVSVAINYQFDFVEPSDELDTVYIFWGDSSFEKVGVGVGVTQVDYDFNHEYADSDDCEFQVEIFYSSDLTKCEFSVQTQVIKNWKTENMGQGEIKLTDSNGNSEIQVCEASDINITLEDRSEFSCIQFDNLSPNDNSRWQQIVYNTTANPNKIPNVYVDGVQVTDANGNDVLSNYNDPRGVYKIEAPVFPNVTKRDALTIISVGGLGNAGDEFAVTLRYWNACNPYDDPEIPGPPSDLLNGDHAPSESTTTIVLTALPQINIDGFSNGCLWSNLTLEANIQSAGDYQINWFLNNSTDTISSENQAELFFDTPGLNEVKVIVTDTYCGEVEEIFNVFIEESPETPNLTVDASNICEGDSATLSVLNESEFIEFMWLKDGTQIHVGSDSLYTAVESGDYSVVVVDLFTGCTSQSSDTVSISVNTRPHGIDSLLTKKCSAQQFSLELQNYISNSVESDFSWSATYDNGINGGVGLGSGNITENLTNETNEISNVTYIISPVSISGLCPGDDFVITVPIHPAPSTSTSEICWDESYNLFSSLNHSDQSGNWLNSDGEIVNPEIDASLFSTGDYLFTYYLDSEICSEVALVLLTIAEEPTIDTDISTAQITSGEFIDLIISGEVDSVLIEVESAHEINGVATNRVIKELPFQTNDTLYHSQQNSITAEYRFTGFKNGCSGEQKITQSIIKPSLITSALREENHDFRVFPNPSEGSVIINGLPDKVELFDNFGNKVIYSAEHQANNTILHLEDIKPGIYNLKIIKNKKVVWSRVILK